MLPKVYRNRNGTLYSMIGGKKVAPPSELSYTEFLKWLIKYMKPKRKRRQPKPKKETKDETPIRDSLEVTPAIAADEGLLRYTNTERERAGRERLDAPIMQGAPPTISEEDQEARRKRKEERKKQREEEKRALVEEKERALEETKRAREEKAAVEEETKKVREEKAEHEEKYSKQTRDRAIERVTDGYYREYFVKLVKHYNPSAQYFKEHLSSKQQMVKYLIEHNDPKIQELIEKEIKEFGSGKDNASYEKGMSNEDIDKVMQPYRPHYLGTIARNGWDELTPAMHT